MDELSRLRERVLSTVTALATGVNGAAAALSEGKEKEGEEDDESQQKLEDEIDDILQAVRASLKASHGFRHALSEYRQAEGEENRQQVLPLLISHLAEINRESAESVELLVAALRRKFAGLRGEAVGDEEEEDEEERYPEMAEFRELRVDVQRALADLGLFLKKGPAPKHTALTSAAADDDLCSSCDSYDTSDLSTDSEEDAPMRVPPTEVAVPDDASSSSSSEDTADSSESDEPVYRPPPALNSSSDRLSNNLALLGLGLGGGKKAPPASAELPARKRDSSAGPRSKGRRKRGGGGSSSSSSGSSSASSGSESDEKPPSLEKMSSFSKYLELLPDEQHTPFLRVKSVANDSPMAAAGVEPGDRMCSFGTFSGKPTTALKDLKKSLDKVVSGTREGGVIMVHMQAERKTKNEGVQHHVHKRISIPVPTGGWSGRGVLGADLVALREHPTIEVSASENSESPAPAGESQKTRKRSPSFADQSGEPSPLRSDPGSASDPELVVHRPRRRSAANLDEGSATTKIATDSRKATVEGGSAQALVSCILNHEFGRVVQESRGTLRASKMARSFIVTYRYFVSEETVLETNAAAAKGKSRPGAISRSKSFATAEDSMLSPPSSKRKHRRSSSTGVLRSDLSEETSRFATFENGPAWKLTVPSTKHLAALGLFSEPSEAHPDCVRCFHCGCKLFGWKEGESAEEKHTDASPDCPVAAAGGSSAPQRSSSGKLRRRGARTSPAQSGTPSPSEAGKDNTYEKNIGGRWFLSEILKAYPRLTQEEMQIPESRGEAATMQLRVIALLKEWIELGFMDFSRDPKMLLQLCAFLYDLDTSLASDAGREWVAKTIEILESRIIDATAGRSKSCALVALKQQVRIAHGDLLDAGHGKKKRKSGPSPMERVSSNLVVSALLRSGVAERLGADVRRKGGKSRASKTSSQANGTAGVFSYSSKGAEFEAIDLFLQKRALMTAEDVKQIVRSMEESGHVRGVIRDGDPKSTERYEFSAVRGEILNLDPDLAPKPEPPSTPGLCQFGDLSPVEIARQMTLIDFWRFRSLPLIELHRQSWNKKDAIKRAPHLMKIVAKFNETCYWVATEIVSTVNPSKRVHAIRKFLKIADALLELKNFHGLMAVVSGLCNVAVQKLHSSWSAIPGSLKKRWEYLQEFAAGANNFLIYRDLAEQAIAASEPFLPHVALILRDLTFAEDGNVDVRAEDGLINWQKFALIGDVLCRFPVALENSYNLIAVPQIRTYLMKDLYVNKDDNELYRSAVECEAAAKESASLSGTLSGRKMRRALTSRGSSAASGSEVLKTREERARALSLQPQGAEKLDRIKRAQSVHVEPRLKRNQSNVIQTSAHVLPSVAAVSKSGFPETATKSDRKSEHALTRKLIKSGKDEMVLKIVFIGDVGIGVSSLVISYVLGTMATGPALEMMTAQKLNEFAVREQLFKKTTETGMGDKGDVEISVVCIDTSAMDRAEPESLVVDADCVALVYGVDNPSSLENVRTKWMRVVQKHARHAAVCLVGTRRDIIDEVTAAGAGRPIPISDVESVSAELNAVFHGEVANSDLDSVRLFMKRTVLLLAENILKK